MNERGFLRFFNSAEDKTQAEYSWEVLERTIRYQDNHIIVHFLSFVDALLLDDLDGFEFAVFLPCFRFSAVAATATASSKSRLAGFSFVAAVLDPFPTLFDLFFSVCFSL